MINILYGLAVILLLLPRTAPQSSNPLQSLTQWNKLIEVHQHHHIIHNIIEYIEYVDRITVEQFLDINEADRFVIQYTTLLNNTGFQLDRHTTEQLIKHTYELLSCIELSSYKQVYIDQHVLQYIVSNQMYATEQQQYRRLVLTNFLSLYPYTAHEYHGLLASHHELINFWWSANMKLYNIYVSNQLYLSNSIAYTIKTISDYTVLDENLNTIFYAISYYNSVQLDMLVKNQLNNQLQYYMQQSQQHQYLLQQHQLAAYKPQRHKTIRFALISEFWFARHSVYRILSNYMNKLNESDRFELTLIVIGDIQYDAGTSVFKYIYNFTDPNYLTRSHLIIQHCIDTQYDIIYFPAVGMSWCDIYLANTRLAPIMIATHGHSVSSYGTLIDYWISGTLVESVSLDHTNTTISNSLYSEQLVLLPGYGAVHTQPDLTHMNNNTYIITDDNITISFPLTAQKIHHTFLMVLYNALQQIDTQLTFHMTIKLQFFCYMKSASRRMILQSHIQSILNQSIYNYIAVEIIIMPEYSYIDYINVIHQSDLCIESLTYGGGNTIVDCIYSARVPILTIQHDVQWYGRIGTAIIQSINDTTLNHTLVSYNTQQLIDKIVRIVLDKSYRIKLHRHIQSTDMSNLFSNMHESNYIVHTMKLLYHRHKNYKIHTDQRKSNGLQPGVIYVQDELNRLKQKANVKTEL